MKISFTPEAEIELADAIVAGLGSEFAAEVPDGGRNKNSTGFGGREYITMYAGDEGGRRSVGQTRCCQTYFDLL